ncbi:hypothetical protein NIES2101_19350 [Calothrix sp. HK-06]|nr:hypothetical protein NIES2101_19350 [Calothrix sp. HK-06]
MYKILCIFLFLSLLSVRKFFDEYYKEDYAYQVAKDTWISDTFHPRSWVLIPRADESLLNGFRTDPSEEWVKGIYFLGAMFKTQIIVVDKLPKTYQLFG